MRREYNITVENFLQYNAINMASALEQYVNNVRTLSSQANYPQLCEFISKQGDILTKQAAHLDNALGTFDMLQHSLGVLGILCAKYNLPATSLPDYETIFVQTQEFVNQCSAEQITCASDSFSDMCHKFTQLVVDKKQPIRGISILCKAIKKLQSSSSQLTSVHADLCQLCLLSKCMKPALQFLDVDITDINKEGNLFDSRHFLLYYYYGGMIYTALKKYEQGLYFFELCIATPSLAVSHIMIEAYKKYILVCLIMHGKLTSLPRQTSPVVFRYIKPLCQHYQDLATVYNTNNPTELKNLIIKNTDTYRNDNNMGLVKQSLTAMYKKNIQCLTKTFLTLSLTDMANRVQLPTPKEAEKYVLQMIEDGEIFATISQKDGMVSFHDNPEKYNNVSMLVSLDNEMQKCVSLVDKLADMDREITVNPQFVQKNTSSNQDDDIPGSSLKAPEVTYAI